MTRKLRLLVAALLALGMIGISTARPTYAATDTVTTCAASGPGSLPEVIAGAAAGDTITFDLDCSGGSAIPLRSVITISENLTIDGTGHDIVIDGGNATQLFSVNAGVTLGLTDLTLSHGNAPYGGAIDNWGTVSITTSNLLYDSATQGGAIYNNGGAVSMTATILSNNSATLDGGAIYNGDFSFSSGTLTISSSILSNNSATSHGGAIYNSWGTLTISSSILSNNSATSHGGAIYNNGGAVSITTSTLSGNSATGYLSTGGAIYNGDTGYLGAVYRGTLTISTSILSNNSASEGGAIDNGATVSITTSTLSGNSATSDGSYGGAIGNSGTVSITTSTLSGNSATGYLSTGGAIGNSYGNVSIGGSIVASSSGGNCVNVGGTITDEGYNLEDDAGASCGFSAGNHDIVGQDPRLDYLQLNGGLTKTMALEAGSPAIDQIPAGTSIMVSPTTSATLCAAGGTDQRGDPRPDASESSCDLGAYESDYPPAPNAPTFGLTSTNSGTTGLTTVNPPTFGGTSGSGDTVNVYADGGTSAICSTTADGSGNWSCTPGTAFSQGTHSITATAGNAGGTSQPSSALSITIDTTNPAVTIAASSEPANPTSSTSASFAWTGSDTYDTITGYTCMLDSGPATDCTSPQSYSNLANGSHTFTVTATDQAGNSGSASYQWTVDTAPPTISISTPATNSAYPLDGSGTRFAFSCSDTYDTVSSCTGSLSGTGISGSTTVQSGDAVPTSSAGSFTLTVNAADQVGNTSKQQVSYTVTNPLPTTGSLNQTSAASGAANFTLKVYGSNFVYNVSQVDWDGTALSGATYYSNGTPVTSTGGLADEIDVTVPSSDLASAGTANVTVVNPGPGGGTSNLQAFYVTPASVSVSASNQATSSSTTGTAIAEVGGSTPGTSGSIAASGSGQGTVVVAQYSGDPETTSPPTAVNAYFDVYVPSGSNFSTVTITDCNLAGGSVLYDWTGSAWAQVPNQTYSAGPPACVTVAISNTSSLAGTPIAVSDQPPTLTLPSGTTVVQQHVSASLQVSAKDPEGDNDVTLSASGLPTGLSLGSTTCTGGTCSASISGSVSAAVGSYTATITATERDASAATAHQTLTVYVDTNLSGYPKQSNGAYNLTSVNLSGAYLVGANLAGANLTSANVSNATLSGASLTGANLSSANFSGANFSGADLTNANLTKTNLKGATGLRTATLTGVIWSKTTCPDNTLSTNDGGTCVGHL